MALFSGWFKKKQPEDYEEVLASLALDIQKRQTRLSEIRLRERRATLIVTLYTLAGWCIYVVLWYAQLLPTLTGSGANSGIEHAVKGAPLIIGPILILLTRRLVQLWYARIGDAEEKKLKELYKTQHTKIEEIKTKTNYYSTRNLIERYDDGASPDSPLRRRPVAQTQGPMTPQRPSPQVALPKGTPSALQTPIRPGLQNQLQPTPQQPLPPPRKQWYDKLADALLGDDDASAPAAAASRYALICQKCFAHNGLVKESMWEDAQYVCPKCGTFNPSARSKKQGNSSPSSPISPAGTPSKANSPQGVASRGPSQLRQPISPARSNDSDSEEGDSMPMDVDSSLSH
ncbi:hypothetical protein OF83DRAFT_1139976 [Amylostereum chailletii]|nr:hypothetical protein OF83DRAFT_1139976 [Amylostereum chailletii]